MLIVRTTRQDASGTGISSPGMERPTAGLHRPAQSSPGCQAHDHPLSFAESLPLPRPGWSVRDVRSLSTAPTRHVDGLAGARTGTCIGSSRHLPPDRRSEMKPLKRFVLLAVVGVAACAWLAGTAASRATDSSTLVVAATTAPDTLNPQQSALNQTWPYWQLSYECLMRTLPSGQVIPWLAKSYTVNPAGTVYTFTLRSGVKFQNGATMRASDVVYTFNLLHSSGIPYAQNRFPTLTERHRALAESGAVHPLGPPARFPAQHGRSVHGGLRDPEPEGRPEQPLEPDGRDRALQPGLVFPEPSAPVQAVQRLLG